MRKIAWVGLVAVLLALCYSCVVSRPTVAPPPPRMERMPAQPGPQFVWISGYWKWTGNHYAWHPGHWAKAPRGKAWVPGHWEKRGSVWVWKSGRWTRR